jgi:hypothetical protein
MDRSSSVVAVDYAENMRSADEVEQALAYSVKG